MKNNKKRTYKLSSSTSRRLLWGACSVVASMQSRTSFVSQEYVVCSSSLGPRKDPARPTLSLAEECQASQE